MMELKTERLILRVASDGEMRTLIAEEADAEMKKAYGEMLAGCLGEPEKRQWYAAWLLFFPTG